MRTIGTLLAVGILALAADCGGSSSTGVDGGGGAAGGGGGVAGGGGAAGGAGGLSGNGGAVGGGGSTGACNLPSCLNAMQTCIPSGTCVEQANATTGATNDCYSNGVKVISAIDASLNITSTVKNGATTCFSMSGSFSALLTGGGLTLKNGSGATIGILSSDATTGATTITCTGASAPVILNDACNLGSSASSSCTTGTCTP